MGTTTGSRAKYSKHKLYTIYLAATDDILAFGTAKECSIQMGISEASVRDLVSRSRSHRRNTYEVYIYPDDADELDEEEML